MGPGKTEFYVEKLIREAQQNGKFNNLANEGQPIKIEEDNPYLDEDWRLAFKVLENGGYVPPWIDLEKEVEGDIQRAYLDRQEHLRWLRRRLQDIKYGPTQNFIRDLHRLNSSHQHFLKAHSQKLDDVNKKIDKFNAVCPVNSLLKIKLLPAEVIRKFDMECPAIPLL